MTGAALDLERLRALAEQVFHPDELVRGGETEELATGALALLALVADLQRERDEARKESKTLRNEVDRLSTGSEIPALRKMVAAQVEQITSAEEAADSWWHRTEAAEARAERAEQALREIAEVQQKALVTIKRNNFVFDDMGHEPGNWQHLAFTLYTYICTVDTVSRGVISAALAGGREEPREEPARFGPICEVDDGSYRAVDRDGVLVVERADSAGALRHVEWESEEQRERWEAAIRREETTRSR